MSAIPLWQTIACWIGFAGFIFAIGCKFWNWTTHLRRGSPGEGSQDAVAKLFQDLEYAGTRNAKQRRT